MIKVNMFLTTRSPDYAYKFIVNACKFNAEKELKKNLKLNILKLTLFPEIKYLLFLLYLFLSGKIFNKKKRALISYEKVALVRFVLAETFKHFKSYDSVYIFYKKFFFNLYKAGIIIKSLKRYFEKKNNFLIEGAYIDHCLYLNGVIFSFLTKKKILLYTNNYPKSIFRFYGKKNKTSNVTYESLLKIKNKIKILGKKKYKLANIILKKMHNKRYLPWMNNTEFLKSKKIKIKSVDYVIYAHSFTDGQLVYGFDGFENTFDWLDFTIQYLNKKKKNIIVKSHPNFYQKNFGERSFYDKKLFGVLKKKYEKNLNIQFIEGPFANIKLLKNLDKKKTILISHHGTVILESAFLGFKTISSSAGFFDTKFKISNFWDNKEQYSSLLDKDFNRLRIVNKVDLSKLVYALFFLTNNEFNNNFWVRIVCKELKITFEEFHKNVVFLGNKNQVNKNFLENRLTSVLFSKIIKKLSKSISDETVC